MLVLEVIEPLEVAFRSQISYHLSHKYGALGHLEAKNFSSEMRYTSWLSKLHKAIGESSETFLQHFKKQYPLSQDLPLWMALEVVSFGHLSRLFQGMKGEDQQAISVHYGLHDTVLASWLHILVYARNLCAHHSRFWNRTLTFKPKFPVKFPLWKGVRNDRIYCLLSMMRYLLKCINPSSTWANRLKALLLAHPEASLQAMGLSENWKDSPLWCNWWCNCR